MMDNAAIEQAAALWRSAQAPVVITGAGISRPSGIPDFRSDSGLWAEYDPIEVASLASFRRNPERFFSWVRPLVDLMAQAKPNPAHIALAELEQAGRLKAIITQNIDGLHQQAGSREVFEVHGHLRTAQCLECEREVPAETVFQTVRRGQVPLCDCGGVFKPMIVLFDELLPRGIFWLAQRALEQADLIVVVGTSLEVAPVSEMPLKPMQRNVPLLIINLAETYLDSHASLVLHEDVAVALPAIVERLREA